MMTCRFHNDDGSADVTWNPQHPMNHTIMVTWGTWRRFDMSDMEFMTFLCDLAEKEDNVKRSPAPSFRRPQFQFSRPWFGNRDDTNTMTWERDRKREYWSAETTSDSHAWKNQRIRWPYPGEPNYEPPSP